MPIVKYSLNIFTALTLALIVVIGAGCSEPGRIGSEFRNASTGAWDRASTIIMRSFSEDGTTVIRDNVIIDERSWSYRERALLGDGDDVCAENFSVKIDLASLQDVYAELESSEIVLRCFPSTECIQIRRAENRCEHRTTDPIVGYDEYTISVSQADDAADFVEILNVNRIGARYDSSRTIAH